MAAALGLTLGLGLWATPASAQDALGLARSFLASQQRPGGELAGLPIVDTAEAVAALDDPRVRDAALFALAQARPDNNQAAFARAAALAGTPFADPIAASVLSRMVAEGTLGLAPGAGGADPLVLAQALQWAAADPASAGLAPPLVAVLAGLQRPDGGFGFADEPSDLSLTAEIARRLAALQGVPGAGALQPAAVSFLAAQAPLGLPAADLALLLLARPELDEGATAAIATALLGRQDGSGAFDGDVRSTALAVRALSRALPDLSIAMPLAGVDDPAAGMAFAFNVTVRNLGRMGAPATRIAATVVDAAGVTTFAGSFEVGAVAAGAARTVALSLGTQGAPGARTLTAVVDPEGAITESAKDNNVLVFRYRVARPADLVIEAADIAAAPVPPALHQSLDVTVRVRNVGEATAHDVHAQLFSGDPASGGTLVAEVFFNAVAPGTPRTFGGRIVPRTLDPLRVLARVDPENAVLEADESNNVAWIDLRPVAPADVTFDVTGAILAGRTQLKQGEPLNFSYALSSGAIRYGMPCWDTSLFPFAGIDAVLYQGLPGVGPVVSHHFFTNLEQTLIGFSVPVSMSTSGWAEGSYDFTLVSDPANLIAERDETNNVTVQTFRIVTDDLPELWIDPATVKPEAVPAPAGQPVTIHATLRNTGRRPATQIPVAIQAAGRNFDLTVPELQPGGSADVPVTVTAPPEPGYQALVYTVDPAATIAENTRWNNYLQTTFLVGGRLEPTLAVDPDPIQAGAPARVLATIRNTGIANAYSISMRVDIPATGEILGQITTDQYPAVGSTLTVPIPIATGKLVGDVEARFYMSAMGAPAEWLPLVLHAVNPDFAVSSAAIHLDPDPAVPGKPVVPSVVVDNLGRLGAPTSVRLYRGYPEQGDLVASGSVFVPAGGAATFTGAAFQAPAAPPYVVTAVLDEEDAWREPDESNNRATRLVVKPVGGAVVAFDETHGPPLTSGTNSAPYEPAALADWARDLVARGYTVTTLNPDEEGLRAAKLIGVDALVVVLPATAYSSEEREVLRAFFRAGGGLAYIGDWGSAESPPAWQAMEDSFVSFLGVTNAHASVGAGGVECSGVWPAFTRPQWYLGEILDHPTTTGLKAVYGNLTGGFSAIPPGGQVLLRTAGLQGPPGTIVAAAFPFEQGRVVVLGDTQFFDSVPHDSMSCGSAVLYGGDNRRFALQIVDWLVGGGAKDYLPDLAFVPAAIALDRPVVTAGDQVVASFTVKNVGGSLAQAGGAVVRVYDGDAASGTLLAEFPLDALAVDAGQRFQLTWDTTLRGGDRVLTAVVDPDGAVQELDESNNVLAVPVLVRAANDLRVDPSDIAPARDGSATLTVTVHNVGWVDAPAGGSLVVADSTGSGAPAVTPVTLPAIPARGAASAQIPWRVDPAQRHAVTVKVDPDRMRIDPTRDDDTASAAFSPPALEVAAPLPGTTWGGVKSVRWTARSDDNPALTYFVALAPAGGAYTGLGTSRSPILDLDTRAWPDGDYVVRVVASDGALATTREVPFTISNTSRSVRAFGAPPGGGVASFDPAGGSTAIFVPAGARVESATALMDAEPAPSAMSAGAVNGGAAGLFELAGRIYYFSVEYPTPWGADLGVRVSLDGGATWSDRVPLFAGDVGSVFQNRHGFHAFFGFYGYPPTRYSRSADGETWTTPVEVLRGSAISVTDDGIAVVAGAGAASISVADPDGRNWSPRIYMPPFWNMWGLQPLVAGGAIHFLATDGAGTRYSRAGWGSNLGDAAVYSAPVTLDTGTAGSMAPYFSGDALGVAYSVFAGEWELRLQRCDLSRDCTRRDGWLPAPIVVGKGSDPRPAVLGPDLQQVVWSYGHEYSLARGPEGGRRWSPQVDSGLRVLGYPAFLPGADFTAVAGNLQGIMTLDRRPGLTPRDLVLDLGGDGAAEVARPGMSGTPVQVSGLEGALNAWLSAHPGEAGPDGLLAVPLAATSAGVGKTLLRNLEVRYRLLGDIAGFADPPLFSPGESPGVLDATLLSMRDPGPLAVMTPSGVPVRSLAAVPLDGRYAALFDGRDDAGALLPSGRYPFGAPGWPVAEVEIDDVLPTAALRGGPEGSYGGVASIQGLATDADFAGSPRNFARYVLDYTLDGLAWQTISVGTSPVDGELGRWDTRGLAAGPATLRLTAWDRAGNSASTARTVSVSPGAPAAPVVQAPTVAGVPVDSLLPAVTVAGAAEPATTVTVFLNGAPAGSAPSDGHWSLSGVALPDGVSTITASASRGGLESPRAQPIAVARYALSVALDMPARAPAGSAVSGTVTVTRVSVAGTSLTVRLSARDEAGHPAGFAIDPAERAVTPPPVGSASFPVTVSTAGAMPGVYRVTAAVVAGNRLPASAEAALALDPWAILAATLASDRAVYDAMQVVALSARLDNLGGAESGPLTAAIAVTPPAGPPVTLGPWPVPSIPRGQSAALSALFGTPPLAVGSYLAELTVADATGTVVSTAATSFDVQPANGAGALSGTLLVNPTTYVPGDVLAATFTVTNAGGDAVVPVSVLLVSQATGAVVSRSDQSMALLQGRTGAGSAALPTLGADGKDLLALLVASGRGLAGQAVTASPFRDTTPPFIRIDGFEDGECRAGPVTPVIVVTDESPFVASSTLDAAPFTSGTQVSVEGDHLVRAAAQDAYGNASEASKGFSIDLTPPRIDVAGVFEGELTNRALYPEVSFFDLHLRAQEVSLDGQPFASGTEVAQEGDHVLAAFADDRAGNTASRTVAFTIDRTPPLILIRGVLPGELTKETVFLEVQVVEAHPGTTAVLLDGAPWDGLPVAAEGDHLVAVEATDLAGNAASASLAFTIDKTPPRIEVTGDGALVNHALLPVVTVTDAHPGSTLVLLDGTPWDGLAVAAEGDHALAVWARDAAGNESTSTARFTVDLTPPAISISGVADGSITRLPVTPVVAVVERHPGPVALLLDGTAWDGAPIAAEGDHLFRVVARDAAGNEASAQVRFTVDRTPPAIAVFGVVDGATYLDQAFPSFTASDAHLGGASATLDGAPFTSGTPVTADGAHVLSVSAWDQAGNQASQLVRFAVVVLRASLAASFDDAPRVLVRLDCAGDPACRQVAAGFLLATLDAAGVGYEVALDQGAFVDLHRTLRHNVRVLYRGASAEYPSDEEVREATFAGGGLVVVNTVPADADPKLDPALGAAAGGSLKSLGTVSFAAGPLGPARSLALAGPGIAQQLLGAEAVARESGGSVVLSTNRYGGGRAVSFTFDPEQNAVPPVGEVLLGAIRYAAGGDRPAAVPGAPQYLAFRAALSSGGPADLRLSATVPPGLDVLAAPLASSLAPPTWSFTLDSGGAAVRSLSVSAAHPGTWTVDATLAAAFGGAFFDRASASVDVGVAASAAELLAAAQAAVTAIPARASDGALRSDALSNLSEVTLAPADRKEAEQSVVHVLHAIDDVLAMSAPEAASARPPLDGLLRAVELLSTGVR